MYTKPKIKDGEGQESPQDISSCYYLNVPGYIGVTKLSPTPHALSDRSYIHITNLLSHRDMSINFFEFLAAINDIARAIMPEITRKLIYLTLQTSRIYCGLATKTVKIQNLQFERQIAKLMNIGVFEPLELKIDTLDPFLRWAKCSTPNLPLSKIKLFKFTDKYRKLFSALEKDLETSLDKETVDIIKHYRFQIKRTHRDILREKKLIASQQKKLLQNAKNDAFSRLVGSCFHCGRACIERLPTRSNPDAHINYRKHLGRLICNDCYKTLYLVKNDGNL